MPTDERSTIERDVWTALYTGVDGAAREAYQLFTVARDEATAEAAFESFLLEEEDAEGDLPAPDTIGKIDFLPGESALAMTARLHQLGYCFVLPLRHQLDDSEVAGLVRTLLRRLVED